MDKNATAFKGSITGGIIGFITGVAIAVVSSDSDGSLAIVDPGSPATAVIIIAVSTVAGALVGWMIAAARE